MNTVKKKTPQRSRSKQLHLRLKHFFHHHVYLLPVTAIVIGFFMLGAALVLLNSETVGPSDSRIVSVFINGDEQVVPTRATTVAGVIEELPTPVGKLDIVEPSLATEISDNDFQINIYKARTVTIVDAGKKTVVTSAEQDLRILVEKAGFMLYPEDAVTAVPVTDPVLEGTLSDKVVIERATVVNFNVYGAPAVIRTRAKTVGELLKEKSVNPAADDTIQPGASTPISENMQIFLLREGHQVASVEEDIPAPTEYRDDATLAKGTTKVQSAGVPGKKIVTYEVVLENGKEVSRHSIQEVVVLQPVSRVVTRGTKVEAALVLYGDKTDVLVSAGVNIDQAPYADYVIAHESGWRLGARNAGGCLGLGQACPGSKLIAACPNYATDAICQIQFFSRYANGRYGSWRGAYNFWLVNRWW